MKKVLIVENKKTRIEEYQGLVDQTLEIDHVRWADDNDFLSFDSWKESREIPDDFWKGFDLLMIHRSYANDIDKLIEIQRANEIRGKDIVFFSGGASAIPEYRVSEKTGKAFLSIEASRFYSNNLIVFLEKYVKEEPINLQYINDGEKWGASISLNSRRIIEQKGIKYFWGTRYKEDLHQVYPQLEELFFMHEDIEESRNEKNAVENVLEKSKNISKWFDFDFNRIFSRSTGTPTLSEKSKFSSPINLDIDQDHTMEPNNDLVFSQDAISLIEELYENELNRIIEKTAI